VREVERDRERAEEVGDERDERRKWAKRVWRDSSRGGVLIACDLVCY